ncbi:MAG: DNA mismatch repair endonuclease MutL, partial [Phycisphaerae bacterium]
DDDLFSIHTMGFRGEALPSIGSVSRLRIVSRLRDSDAGHVIEVDAGETRGPTPSAAPIGTTVEVRDLFYCVPARRRFLRTNQTEMGHIAEQLARIALPHAGVGFALHHQNRVVHALRPAGDRRARIADLFGAELAQGMLAIRRASERLTIDGFAAPPAESRGSSKWEYVFVNGRYIRDKFVSHAIREAYRSLIDSARHPVVFLFITIEPGDVDVNVHPTKIEVRWRDSNLIHGQVLAALREKFLGTRLDHALVPPSDADPHRERARAALVEFFTHARPAPHAGRGADDFPRVADPARGRAGDIPANAHELAAAVSTRLPPDPADASPTAWPREILAIHTLPEAPRSAHVFDTGRNANAAGPAEPLVADASQAAPAPHPAAAGSRAIQVHNAYLVVETPEGVMIVDQHALHERILYEELRRRIAQRPLEAQRLLLPEVVSLPADRVEALETHADTLARLGIELAAAGPQSVALHAYPTFLERLHSAAFVRDLLDALCEPGARPAQDTLLHRLLDMIACKAAVKAGDPLTPLEIDALLARRELAERSSHCPHGRPTTLHLTLRDLEKQFHRR